VSERTFTLSGYKRYPWIFTDSSCELCFMAVSQIRFTGYCIPSACSGFQSPFSRFQYFTLNCSAPNVRPRILFHTPYVRYLHSTFEATPLPTARGFPRKTFGVSIDCSELESTKETVRQFTNLAIPIVGRQHASEYCPAL